MNKKILIFILAAVVATVIVLNQKISDVQRLDDDYRAAAKNVEEFYKANPEPFPENEYLGPNDIERPVQGRQRYLAPYYEN